MSLAHTLLCEMFNSLHVKVHKLGHKEMDFSPVKTMYIVIVLFVNKLGNMSI